MNMKHIHRFRWVALASAVTLLPVLACGFQDTLLEPQQPQVIKPSDVQSSAGAVALYNGALGRLRTSLNGGDNNAERIWNMEALLTDEVRNADTFSQRIDADQRNTQTGDANVTTAYNSVQTSRGYARDGINVLRQYSPTETAKIGEMYMVMGTMELNLGQAFCNGVPLGETISGIPMYTVPLTNAAVFTQAIQRFDSALTVNTGTDAAAVSVRNATIILKAKAQVNLGQFAAAAAAVAPIASNYAYLITYSQTTQSNEWWQMFTNTRRYSVGDSVDINGRTQNALPFVSAADPRVLTARRTNPAAFDGTSPWFELLNWGREDPIALASGIDARLIEAEAKLRASDIAGTMTILNALRTAPPKIGNLTIAALPALAIPATQDAAVSLFFREKAFWQYGRGERLNDMRRLIRQYGRTQDTVFPVGPYVRGGNYGTRVNFPVPDAEKSNPNFTGCLDNNA